MKPGMKFRHGRGCQHCYNTGYSGRIAVFEIMMVTPKIRELIYNHVGRAAIEEELHKPENAFVSLKEAGARLVLEGITTSFEVMRITNELD
jgi:type IV pilus assembly protein PilB